MRLWFRRVFGINGENPARLLDEHQQERTNNPHTVDDAHRDSEELLAEYRKAQANWKTL
jgi:hypothetical protein